jgi:hypothetical protein
VTLGTAQELRLPPDGGPRAPRPAGFFCALLVDKKLIAAALLAAFPLAAAIGLAVTYPDMVLEQVAPGTVFRSFKDKGVPYVVLNKTDGPVEVEVLVEARPPKDVKPGYEPIPDVSWIQITPARFTMEKGEKKSLELTLSVPKDKALVGRHFEAALHARTVGTGFLAAGVLHTFSFSVGTGAPAAKPAAAPPTKKK